MNESSNQDLDEYDRDRESTSSSFYSFSLATKSAPSSSCATPTNKTRGSTASGTLKTFFDTVNNKEKVSEYQNS